MGTSVPAPSSHEAHGRGQASGSLHLDPNPDSAPDCFSACLDDSTLYLCFFLCYMMMLLKRIPVPSGYVEDEIKECIKVNEYTVWYMIDNHESHVPSQGQLDGLGLLSSSFSLHLRPWRILP